MNKQQLKNRYSKMKSTYYLPLLFVTAIGLAGCRGTISEKPPVHPQLNMDFQESYEAQEKNVFYADNRAMREPVEGTIPRGKWKSNPELHYGKNANGDFVPTIPVKVDEAFIKRGKEQYEIFCTPCHGGTGAGNGIVVDYGLVPPTSYHIDRLREIEDGYLYDVIVNGVRSMYGYGSQIPDVEDRWAIVAYMRALQVSQNASESDIPADKLQEIKSAE